MECLKRYVFKHLKMSVIKAILFYSRRNAKSYKMKQVIDSVGADIETVSVDSVEVRDRLMEDEKYGIDEVPAVLLLYSSGQHKTYTNHGLDEWFGQLLQNIEQYHLEQQQATMPPPPPPEQAYTQLDIPKPLRGKPGDSSDIPTSLPSPGRPFNGNDITVIDDPVQNQPSGLSAAHSAMISEHIKDADPLVPITSDPHIQTGRKEVKKEGLSAGELAKQMAEQREQIEEKLEESRPFV